MSDDYFMCSLSTKSLS